MANVGREYLRKRVANGEAFEKVWAEFEGVAAELDGCLCRYLSEDLSAEFVYSVMLLRAGSLQVTASGVLSAALTLGLPALIAQMGPAVVDKVVKPKGKPRRQTVRGI